MLFDKEAWKAQCRENARSLENEINQLQSDYSDLLGLFWRRYDEFWAHARRISEMFKTLKPLFREDRERLWAAYSTACEEMKQAQAREQESRLNDSREKRDLVMSKIWEAYFQAKAADSAEFAQADALLGEALAWMKNGWEGLNTITQLISPILSSGIMKWEDREECWAEWKDAKDLLRLRRDEFYADMCATRAGRWRDWVEENDDLIETLQAEIDECEDLERSARTEEFAERIRDRIEAKMRKIAGLEERNEELECKIAAVES